MHLFRCVLLILSLLVATCRCVTAQTTTVWTLEKCIEHALKNNLGIQQAQLQAQSGRYNYLQSYLNLLPNLSAFINQDWTNGQQFSLAAFRVVNATTTTFATGANADLTLFAGLQQVHNILRNKQDLLAAHFDLEDLRNTTILNVTTAFLQLMTNRELLRIAENQLRTSQLQRDAAEKRVKAGALPETALLDLQAQVARDEAGVTNARNAFELSKLGLRLILQLKPDEPFEVSLPELSYEPARTSTTGSALQVYQTAVAVQPSILAAQARLQSAAYSRRMAWGALLPTITLNASLYDYYTNQQKAFDTTVNEFVTIPFRTQFRDQFRKGIGLTLTVPLLSRGQRMINIANTKIQYQIAKLQLENRKNALLQTIYEADAQLRAAAEAYAAAKKSYDAAAAAFAAQEKRYLSGSSSLPDYQISRNNLAAAESELVRQKYTYIFRKKVLDFYEGKPINLQEF